MPGIADVNAEGLPLERLDTIDRYVAAELARQRIPGLALGVYRHGGTLVAKGYGLANVEHRVPVTADTVMQSGSIGKCFTATAVMMLVEQGRLRLDDSIAATFPEGPASWEPITIANLLSHTSGLGAYDTRERSRRGGAFDLHRDLSDDEIVAKIAAIPTDFAAGSDWNYTNTNYVLLGILIHRVTGLSYARVLEQTIFTPLAMTASRIISDRDIVPNRSAGYQIENGVLRNQDWVAPTFNATGDGALYLSVRDLGRWDRALGEARLLTRETLERMWTPYRLESGAPNAYGYGLGWRVQQLTGRKVVEHDGAWQGFTTLLSRYVDCGLTVAVLANLHAEHCRLDHVVRAIVEAVEATD